MQDRRHPRLATMQRTHASAGTGWRARIWYHVIPLYIRTVSSALDGWPALAAWLALAIVGSRWLALAILDSVDPRGALARRHFGGAPARLRWGRSRSAKLSVDLRGLSVVVRGGIT